MDFFKRFINEIFSYIYSNKTKQLEINDTEQIFIKINFLRSICKLAFSFTL